MQNNCLIGSAPPCFRTRFGLVGTLAAHGFLTVPRVYIYIYIGYSSVQKLSLCWAHQLELHSQELWFELLSLSPPQFRKHLKSVLVYSNFTGSGGWDLGVPLMGLFLK